LPNYTKNPFASRSEKPINSRAASSSRTHTTNN
jgi:hypothetical protein